LTDTVQLALEASVPPNKLTELPPATAVAVPLQVLVRFGVGATTRPAGRLSVNATPVSDNPLFGFWMVKVNDVVPFSGMVAAPNTLVIDGGLATVRVALAVFPVPPLVELTAPDVLVNVPEVVPVTLTERTQELLTAIVPPVRLMPVPPAVATTVPPQVLVKPFGVATSRPVGSVSVKATPASATVLAAGLVMVKVRVVVPFTAIAVGLNAFAMEGGATTVSGAEAVLPAPPLVDDTAPEVLIKEPAVFPVTFTTRVQELFTAMVPPVRLMLVPPAVAAAVPPQLLVNPFGVETSSPVGSVSLKATPAAATVFVAGLVRVKVSVLVPFNGIEVGLNTLAMEGGLTTVILAVLVFPVPALADVT
jgi:hypothetical protein